MKLRQIFTTMAAAAVIAPAAADINIQYSGDAGATFHLTSLPIEEYIKGRKAVKTIVNDSIDITPGKAGKFETPGFNAINFLTMGEKGRQTFYTAPGEDVKVIVSPAGTTFSGTQLLDEMTGIDKLLAPVMSRYEQLQATGTVSEEAMEQIYADYDKVICDYITANPGTPGAVYAVTEIQNPETLTMMFPKLTGVALTSIIYPLAENANRWAKETIESEKRQKELASGNVTAPAFTLPGLDGENISLSQYTGKWVILDFWGSWCMWCIKGFPALKEAYTKYAGKVEIIGIDCGDTREAWKAAVEKYKLPWVHVYNADGPQSVDKTYAIQGYPTKMIVNPEGKIVNITTGEDPSFFDTLDSFVNNK